MNSSLKILSLTGALCVGFLTLHAADKKHLGGPKGGRLLEKTEPKAEFLVEKDHTVTITFYDANLKPVAAAGQAVAVIVEAKDGKTTLGFQRKGHALVSQGKLPEGDGYNLVVQFRQTAAAKPQNFRFKLDLGVCGGCHRAEYACTCDE